MKLLKNYKNFMLKEDIAAIAEPMIDAPASGGDLTLYRLTSHPVVDLSAPGEFYVKSVDDLNPDFLENKEGDELFVITVTCPSSNINAEKSEAECARHNCDSIVSVNDDTQCDIVEVKPYNK